MVTETEIQAAPSEEANLAPQTDTQTETPVESAVAPAEEAVASEPQELQVEVTPPESKPMSAEEIERLIEEKAERIKSVALEEDRNRRRTQAAREAQAAERQKARLSQTVDTVKATLVSRGIDPEVATEESVLTAIDRVAQERADALVKDRGDVVGEAWDYITAPVYGQQAELDDSFAEVARVLSPKVQHLINQLTPIIESKAREGYVLESDLPKKVDEEIARRAAKGREGQEELKRVEGSASGRTEAEILADPNTPIATLKEIRDRQKKGG